MHKLIRTLVFVAVSAYAVDAQATASKNTEISAVGIGTADAQVGISKEPAANYYNPAALTRIKHPAISVGVGVLSLEGEFEAGDDVPRGAPELRRGQTEKQILPAAPLPHIFGVYRLEDPNLAFGLGAYAPWASGSEFDENWAGRNNGVLSRLVAYAINPNVAWEVVPGLSVAVGGSLFQSSLEIKESLRTSVGDPAEDIDVEIAADGQGYQGNAAVLYEPTDNLAIGVSYRTAVKVDMEGEVNFGVPSSALAPTFRDQDIKTTTRFPDTLNAGFGIFPKDNVRIDTEIEFVRYNVDREQRIEFETGLPAPAEVLEQDWQNIVAYRAGADWKASQRWSFRAGLAWDPTPIPVNRTTPLTPDADRLVMALGSSYHWRAHVISLGLQLQQFMERTLVYSDIAAGAESPRGSYRHQLYVGGLTWTYKFK